MQIKKKPTDHRQGTFTAIADLIHQLTQEDKTEEDMLETIREIRNFDVTTIGDLYLTSGGRIVIDKGYGEYFTEGDKKLFTLKELKSGIKLQDFKNKICSL